MSVESPAGRVEGVGARRTTDGPALVPAHRPPSIPTGPSPPQRRRRIATASPASPPLASPSPVVSKRRQHRSEATTGLLRGYYESYCYEATTGYYEAASYQATTRYYQATTRILPGYYQATTRSRARATRPAAP